MLNTSAFMKSPYFDEVRNSLAFIKRVKPYAKHLKLPIGTCLCLPTPAKLSKISSLAEPAIQRELHTLMRLQWVRKYQKDGCTAYILGRQKSLYAVERITMRFHCAQRKNDGSLHCSEWRWLPLDKWNCATLWQMIFDKGVERGIDIKPLSSNIVGRKHLKELLIKVGPQVAKRVGEFFVADYKALQLHFKWYGTAHAGLFCGFFSSIRDIQERGFPVNAVHDRGQQQAAESLVEEEWHEF